MSASQFGPGEASTEQAGPAEASTGQASTEQASTGAICVGWQYVPAAGDPGPAPARPAAPAVLRLDPHWVTAQRRITRRAGRPAAAGGAATGLLAAGLASAWIAGLLSPALAAFACAAVVTCGLRCAGSFWRGERRLSALIAAERQRVEQISAAESASLAVSQREHASQYRAWQRRKAVFERQRSWFDVTLPAGIDRLDIAGGTLSGWSALLTTLAATHLSAGGQVTIVDLTEGTVAADLAVLSAGSGLRPLVWVLPGDLPRLDLGVGFGPAVLADVLALTAGGGAGGGTAGGGNAGGGTAAYATDCALLERVLNVLGHPAGLMPLMAALRVLADVGDPRADLRAGLLTAEQFERISTLFGRGGAERVVIERALTLESKLRSLERLSAVSVLLPPSPLRVVALDRRAGVIGNLTIRTYLVAALTQLLRQVPPGRPWQHTVCLLGAERLDGDAIDRLTSACEISRTGLVLGYAAMPGTVRERLGRGNAAIAFMRLGNGDEAKAASELIGTEHRFVVSQLTDTVGTSVTDTWGDSYTSTVGTADSVSESVSVSRNAGASSGRGRSAQGGFAPFGEFSKTSSQDQNFSLGSQDSVSLTKGINSGTSWGISMSRALGENASLGRTSQRSREFLVEPDELQRLPQSAAIISYPSAAGRAVVLADANPAISSLSSAAMIGAAASAADNAGRAMTHSEGAATIPPG